MAAFSTPAAAGVSFPIQPMSLRGIVWAFDQDIKPAHVKFVLVVLAKFGTETGITYPHDSTVSRLTGLTVETVRKSIDTLVDAGLITDTGKTVRNGEQVKVYQLPSAARDFHEHEEPERKVNPKRGRGTLDDVINFCMNRDGHGLSIPLPRSDAEYFFNKWESNGWRNGGQAIRDWKAVIRSWQAGGYCPSQKVNGQAAPPKQGSTSKFLDKAMRQERLI